MLATHTADPFAMRADAAKFSVVAGNVNDEVDELARESASASRNDPLAEPLDSIESEKVPLLPPCAPPPPALLLPAPPM